MKHLDIKLVIQIFATAARPYGKSDEENTEQRPH